MDLDEIRARVLAAPTSSAGDPPWLADARALLAALDARSRLIARVRNAALDFASTGRDDATRDLLNELADALELGGVNVNF